MRAIFARVVVTRVAPNMKTLNILAGTFTKKFGETVRKSGCIISVCSACLEYITLYKQQFRHKFGQIFADLG